MTPRCGAGDVGSLWIAWRPCTIPGVIDRKGALVFERVGQPDLGLVNLAVLEDLLAGQFDTAEEGLEPVSRTFPFRMQSVSEFSGC